MMTPLEVVAAFIGCMIVGLLVQSVLNSVGLSEKAAPGLGFVVWVTAFWMGALFWIWAGFEGDRRRRERQERIGGSGS